MLEMAEAVPRAVVFLGAGFSALVRLARVLIAISGLVEPVDLDALTPLARLLDSFSGGTSEIVGLELDADIAGELSASSGSDSSGSLIRGRFFAGELLI